MKALWAKCHVYVSLLQGPESEVDDMEQFVLERRWLWVTESERVFQR